MKTVEFDLKDADGESHRYEVELFSCDENVALQLIIAAPLMQTIGRTLAAVLPAVEGQAMSDVFKDMDSLSEALRRVDWTRAPDALISIPQMIEAQGGPALVQRIWAKTYRLLPIAELQNVATAHGDGKIESDYRQHLALAPERDNAFGDGNFAEYWQAVAMVLIVNFTRFGRNGSGSLSGLAESLMSAAAIPSHPTTGTAPPSNAGKTGTSVPPR
jgi:hypothetical protein